MPFFVFFGFLLKSLFNCLVYLFVLCVRNGVLLFVWEWQSKKDGITGLPRLRLAMTGGMKGRELVAWGVGLRDPIPTCVGMTKNTEMEKGLVFITKITPTGCGGIILSFVMIVYGNHNIEIW